MKHSQLVQTYNDAVSAFRARNYIHAEQICQRILAEAPNFFEAIYLLGAVQSSLGKNDLAVATYDRALTLRPDFAEALYNRGNVLKRLARLDEALASYDRSIALRPDYAMAFSNRGNTLAEMKRFDEALASYDRALALQPNLAEAHYNRGNALYALNQFKQALTSYDRALAVRPTYARALYSRGNSLAKLKRFEEALASYDQALTLEPGDAEALYNRGNTLRELNRLDDALESYNGSISVRPDDANAFSNRAVTLHELRRFDEAFASFERALTLRPDDPDILYNVGSTLNELRRYDEALIVLDRVLAKNREHTYAPSAAAFSAINLCDWSRCEEFSQIIKAHVSTRKSVVSPFTLLAYSDDLALQLQCAKNYAESKSLSVPKPMWTGRAWRNEKIRVAYLSADFHSHATSFLMAELFELHDRSRFEIIGVSFGPDDESDTRKRVISAFDTFHDVRQKSGLEVARQLQALQVDIALDLKGYTLASRPEILSHRPAPIQVNYLGYPATMGAHFIDYIIADEIVAPFGHQPFYSEKIVHLPDCYQPNDTKRMIAEQTVTRHDVGLPDDKFVFCCFNNNWKITPEIFDVWMRLLHQVDRSVLWLLKNSNGAERNLRNEADKRGIDPSRLVFAERLPIHEHLARHALADLFLDTLPYGAHTTASDALWAGLPVLTCRGRAFAGRVGASVLRAINASELVASNLEEYETLAVKLARDPVLQLQLKAKIVGNRNTCPLFNTERFVRHIEAAYNTMWETWQRGQPPGSFAVKPIE